MEHLMEHVLSIQPHSKVPFTMPKDACTLLRLPHVILFFLIQYVEDPRMPLKLNWMDSLLLSFSWQYPHITGHVRLVWLVNETYVSKGSKTA